MELSGGRTRRRKTECHADLLRRRIHLTGRAAGDARHDAGSSVAPGLKRVHLDHGKQSLRVVRLFIIFSGGGVALYDTLTQQPVEIGVERRRGAEES